MVSTFKKSDTIISLILGEIIAIFFIVIQRNLKQDIPAIDIFTNFKWLILFLGYAPVLTYPIYDFVDLLPKST